MVGSMRWKGLALLAALLCACGGEEDKDSAAGTPHQGHGSGTTAKPTPNTLTTDGGSWEVGYTSTPDPIPLSEAFSLLLTVTEVGSGAPVEASVLVDASMPSHGHGMTTSPVTTDQGGGTYLVEGMLFHMEGSWELAVDVAVGGAAERAVFTVACCE